MVDGNLYDGVIEIDLDNETRYIEYKLGNPVTILSEYDDAGKSKNNVLKLTSYEYCIMSCVIGK